ncbi:DoxX family protein [soil metagenome]
MRMTDVLFGVNRNERTTDIGLLVLRVLGALTLVLLHGWGKVPPKPGFVGMLGGMGFPAPEIFAWLAALAEFGGGLLLAIGLLTRPAAFLLVGHFAIVVLVAHAGETFKERELPFLFLVIALTLLFTGAGRYSVDAALRDRPHYG